MVPIELVGESQAVKDGNILVTVTDEIEVEGLPADLPEKIEIDLSVLENLESTITVADLKIGDKLEILTDLEQLIAKVEEPKAEEEPVVEEVSPEDVEVITQKEGKDEEGAEAGAEEGDKEKKEE